MALTKKVAPPNSLVLVSDLGGGEIPKTMVGELVSATNTCMAVGCLAEADGPTEITLAPLLEIDRAEEPIFEGLPRTPRRHIVIRSVFGQHLLELPVMQELTKVKIWANDPREPDKLVIGVG
jgi:hypothetical protein